MRLKLSDVLPNPYRDLKFNPLQEKRIQRLIESINQIGFFDNVVVRKNKEGRYELAYGHHRVEAAKRAGLEEADFIVKKYSNLQMIQAMRNDNDEEFGVGIVASVVEAVRALVLSLAAGDVEPFEVSKDTRKDSIRYAPSYVPGVEPGGKSSPRPYTASLLGQKLGFVVSKGEGKFKASEPLEAALGVLELTERGLFKPEQLQSYTSTDALLRDVRRIKELHVERMTVAKKAAKEAEELNAKREAETAKRKAEEEAARKKRDELLAKAVEARKADDKKKAEEAKERAKQEEERDAARKVEFEEKRKALDSKIQEAKQREEQAKKDASEAPVRHLVNTVLFRVKNITSEHNDLRDLLARAAKEHRVTVNERELLRQALNDAAEWFRSQSNFFLPTGEYVRPKPTKGGKKK